MNQKQKKKAELLASQHRDAEQETSEIEAARRSLEEKAAQLALASKAKSEFLANISHELRTPLNSLLVLSELLAENDEGNLTKKQIEFAETIHACGSELLALINDILDLAKIESGKMVVDLKPVTLTDLKKDLERNFCEPARLKKLNFRIEITERTVPSIVTDGKRLSQVLKNLLSNAMKFTDKGSVELLIDQSTTALASNTALGRTTQVLSFAVSDTGIGIAKDKQNMIFDPFQQADGTTSRKYGGTGLGLAISREIASLLDGQLEVESALGKGSKFTLQLPVLGGTDDSSEDAPGKDNSGITPVRPLVLERKDAEPPELEQEVADDRFEIVEGDMVLLIIEHDSRFAGMVQNLAHERGFKTIITESGVAGVTLAEKFLPRAITLNLKLADGAGWTTLECLRRSHKTRQIPLQLVSIDGQNSQGLALRGPGTKSFEQLLDEARLFLDRTLEKLPDDGTSKVRQAPTRHSESVLANRTVLVLDDDPRNVLAISELLAKHSMRILHAGNGRDGLDLLYKTPGIDCILMDVMMPKLDGFETMKELRQSSQYCDLPIIALTAKAMPGDREKCLDAGASDYISKPVNTKQLLSLLQLWLSK